MSVEIKGGKRGIRCSRVYEDRDKYNDIQVLQEWLRQRKGLGILIYTLICNKDERIARPVAIRKCKILILIQIPYDPH